jgi:hypothetical protein
VTVTSAPTPTPSRTRRLHRRLPGGRLLGDGTALYWWGELVFVIVFYVAYSVVRNANGNDPGAAYRNAIQLIGWQKTLGLNHEHLLQQWALHFKPLIYFCNYFYGSLHFIVTAGVMIFLYRKFSNEYPVWRNTLAITTGLALIGFTFWPLMPPRLLDGFITQHHLAHAHFHFVDTVDKYPAFWSFKRGAVSKISNQFAAMPSVHCAWALWCTLALVPRLKRNWAKCLAVAYPICTVTAIVLTANHYFLDVVGGFLTLGLGFAAARVFTRSGRRTTSPDESTDSPSEPAAVVPV